MKLNISVAIALASALAIIPASAKKHKTAAPDNAPRIAQMAPDEQILHALNRLTFGPRPGDFDQVKKIGLNRWIEQQLHPEDIPENPVLEAKLQPLDTLRMSTIEMAQAYPPPQTIKAMVEGRVPWPADLETRYMVQKFAAKYRDKLGLAGDNAPQEPMERVAQELDPVRQKAFDGGTPAERVAVLETLPADKQYDLLTSMPQPMRQKLFPIASPALRRKIEKTAGPVTVVNQDLFQGKLLRAVYSNRQLEEVLTDFWYNHFNVYLDKGADRYLVTSYERDVIRPHVLGKFEDLLLATAQSPAMLFYLDNFQSVGPDTKVNANAKRPKRGLNENYGRELMELHTLGVDGGYTQHDVTEVARCFTGWTIRDPRRGAGFEYNDRQHDKGEKNVLGVRIAAGGGMEDGLKVINILAHQPATAHFISKSLAIRFVSDAPPESLISRMSQTFLSTNGDLRQVTETMINSPEFWAATYYRAKIKSPLEMVASAIRAVNADVDFSFSLAQQLNQLGEPLYRKQEPTGYSNKSSDWVNSAELLGRMNFALALTSNKIPGVKVDLPPYSDSPDGMAHALLMSDLSAETRAAIEKSLAEQPASTDPKGGASRGALVAGLTLGSPDFQRR